MTAAPPLPTCLALVARDIKLSHTVFALPFALLAGFMAAGHSGHSLTWPTLGLIVVCMVLARTMAMAVNRWADAKIDAANPRTAGRAIPAGRLPASFMRGVAVVCAAGFVTAAGGFWLVNDNPWPLVASPAVLAWLAGYSYTKRFTSLCHLYLGSALALSPLAAATAVAPGYMGTPEPYFLAAMVMCWVAGFDVIYALQDVDLDRQHGLFSMPARLGVEPALWVSRALHVASLAALALLWRSSPQLGTGFAIGIALVAGLLLLEHALVWRSKTKHIHMVFFTLNGVISLVLGGLGIADVLT